jgi:hypothetical protein
MITDENLKFIRDAATKASQDTWYWGVTPPDREAARKWLTDCFDKGEADQGHMVVITDGDKPLEVSSLCVAFTGNGPTSEANARFIATMSPANVLLLLDYIDEMKVYVP